MLFLLAMGFLQAALTEETIKVISAFGARCPCCLRDAGGCPWFPCCVPRWNGADASSSGVTNPYSIILYMVCAGAGFSTIENCEYLFLAGGGPAAPFPKCYEVRCYAVL